MEGKSLSLSSATPGASAAVSHQAEAGEVRLQRLERHFSVIFPVRR